MDKIFALDIGTRKVRGLLAEYADTSLRIVDCEILEHETRAMFAGQIHDIEKVAKVVERIKRILEERNNLHLEKVAVAVAGRMLRTFREKMKKKINPDEEIKIEEVRNLELSALQAVVNRLSGESMEFYCVGYSVVNRCLDRERISNLVGQKGEEIEVEILATFLPKKVLQSIFTVLKKVNLEVSSLTLEPIAAINAIVPPDMRRLNLALVDIGAGTSDIAITRRGSIIAYGMVPVAGDEITEKLCESYLLDFPTAERIKRCLSAEEKVTFADIFGRGYELLSREVIGEILPAVENLARKIADEILTLNQSSPHAVVCVGGGSQTPYLEEKLAAVLSLEKRQVGVRRMEMTKSIEDETGKLSGPDGVTPTGIALLAAEREGLEFLNVMVNGKPLHLVKLGGRLTVFSALLQAGMNVKKMYPRPGLAKTFELNGQMRFVKGTLGKNAEIRLNGNLVTPDTHICDDDEITFIEAVDGEDAKMKLSVLIGEMQIKRIFLNGKEIRINPLIMVNGKPEENLEVEIPDRGKIVILPNSSLREILLKEDYPVGMEAMREIGILVNGNTKFFKQKNYQLQVNNQEVTYDYLVNDGDIISYQVFPEILYQIKDVADLPTVGKDLRVKVNGEEYIFPGGKGKIFLNGREASPEDRVFDSAVIEIRPGKDAEVILADIFRYVSLELESQESLKLIGRDNSRLGSRMPGKKLKLLVNDEEARFTSPLADGSEVKIYFE